MAADRRAAEGEAVFEGAGGIAIGDPLLLRILEIAKLDVRALSHVLGVGADGGVLQLLVALVQKLIGLVGRSRDAGFVFGSGMLSAQVW